LLDLPRWTQAHGLLDLACGLTLPPRPLCTALVPYEPVLAQAV
jgi:hypothetical protein